MDILLVILQVVLAITSVLLILFILLHRGKGGGVSDMFGGGVSTNIQSSGVAEKNLNRLTAWTLTIWLVVVVLMGVIAKFQTPGLV